MTSTVCPPAASFFGFMGAASALIFSNFGAAYGTAKSGVGVASMGVMRPELVMRCILPVVLAGVLGIVRPDCRCDRVRPGRGGELPVLPWICAPRFRSLQRSQWACCRYLHWHRR
eukprot:TRINITY_DN3547_c0_g1_i2.p1 TRINITY_DN3547_c0_g1~~TRINITY_DN3547_c0_g1_i2.p1  ORF type:complete len:115 (-),score=3.99 TRINITY_DN3547_c0_g1_i2:57-401(-)